MELAQTRNELAVLARPVIKVRFVIMGTYENFKRIVEERKSRYSKKKVNLVERYIDAVSLSVNKSQTSKKKICSVCGGPMGKSHYENVCSRKCSEIKLLYNFIQIPEIFAMRLLQHSKDENEISEELTKFAIRHKYDESLVKQKFKEKFQS